MSVHQLHSDPGPRQTPPLAPLTPVSAVMWSHEPFFPRAGDADRRHSGAKHQTSRNPRGSPGPGRGPGSWAASWGPCCPRHLEELLSFPEEPPREHRARDSGFPPPQACPQCTPTGPLLSRTTLRWGLGEGACAGLSHRLPAHSRLVRQCTTMNSMQAGVPRRPGAEQGPA